MLVDDTALLDAHECIFNHGWRDATKLSGDLDGNVDLLNIVLFHQMEIQRVGSGIAL